MNIYLIGFMGSGKTTYGKLLARALDFNFIDLDEEIENTSKKSINELFESGENYFRKIERDFLLTTASLNNHVVSTGGGIPCYLNNMEWMNQNGITVYLKLDSKDLYNNLSELFLHRPLLKTIPKNELLNFIDIMLEKRALFYNKAAIVINPISISPQRLTELIQIN